MKRLYRLVLLIQQWLTQNSRAMIFQKEVWFLHFWVQPCTIQKHLFYVIYMPIFFFFVFKTKLKKGKINHKNITANEFHPERFLDKAGNLCLSKDITIPFGAGKRLCAGETFARNMLFLCTTAILQAFTIRMANGAKPLKFSENMTGLIRTPKDHWIELTAR